MKVIITGASSGLGAEIAVALLSYTDDITDWSLSTGVDLTSPVAIQKAAAKCGTQPVDVLINCAGVNEVEWLPRMTTDVWDYLMDVNARGILLTTQALLENLRGGTILNIVSNASHVPMTCSIAYNASKAAAAIMTKQMSRELGKTHGITVFAISPNKLNGTGMSQYIETRVQATRGWSAEEASRYQLAALPAGEETDPVVLAEFIAFLLSSKARHKYLAGCDIPYGGP